MTEAQVLPFRRPDLVIFERFDVEDMAAMFRSRKGRDTYHFTLLPDGTLEDAYVERDSALIAPLGEFSETQRDTVERLVKYARDMLKDQLATWHKLSPGEQLSLLIEWGNDMVKRLGEAIRAAAEADAMEFNEEIALMCHDLDTHDAYVAGLETARSLL